MSRKHANPPAWIADTKPAGLLTGLLQSGTSPTGTAASGCFQNEDHSSKSGVTVMEGAIPMHVYRPREPGKRRKVA